MGWVATLRLWAIFFTFSAFFSRTSTIDDPTSGSTGHGGTGHGDHAVVEDDYDSDYGEEDFEDGENDGELDTLDLGAIHKVFFCGI